MEEQTKQITLTVEQTARMLGICPNSAYALFHSESFPAFRVGRKLLVSRDALTRWIEQQQQA